jgi:hypothetical protein
MGNDEKGPATLGNQSRFLGIEVHCRLGRSGACH